MKPTELYLVSGFLGAGKTTLVKRLLDHNTQKRIGIIMNEFGKVSIDGPILQREGLEMTELTRGSIFCSCLTMAFAEALVEMAGKGLDHVVVESSGLADPSNIGGILEGVATQVEVPFVYSGSIVVVDAARFMTEIETIETISKQIECADLTYINKCDLVDDATLQSIKDRISEINDKTQIVSTSFFEGISDFLGRDLSGGAYPKLRASINTPENKPKTMSISFDDQVPEDKLHAFIQEALQSAFRVKGFVRMADGWKEVHGVGDAVDFYETDRTMDASTLVIISKVGPNIIRLVDAAWKSHVGTAMRMSNG